MGKNILINLVLINESFKATRYGAYVEADTEAGEYILDFDDLDSLPSKAAMLEIADKNKVKIENRGGKKGEIAEALQSGLSKRKIPEQNEKPDSVKVAEIVAAGAGKKTDEEMIVEIITSGVKFKAANRMFTKAMAEGGHRISTKDRKERILAILTEAEFSPESYDDVEEMLATITTGDDKVPETTESQAIREMKAFCKEAEIDFPKAAKKPKGGFKKQVQDHVLANPLISKKKFSKFVIGAGKDEKTVTRMWPAIEFAQAVAAATIALSDQDSDDADAEEETED